MWWARRTSFASEHASAACASDGPTMARAGVPAAHPRLTELLEEQREATRAFERKSGSVCPWVFHRAGHQVAWHYEAWKTACEKAEMPGRLLDDLRRSAVRNLVRAGVSEHVAMTLTGPKTRAIFNRHHIVSSTDQVEAVRKLA